jgi:hypothetical protein
MQRFPKNEGKPYSHEVFLTQKLGTQPNQVYKLMIMCSTTPLLKFEHKKNHGTTVDI